MSVREEFEKSFIEAKCSSIHGDDFKIALWAAKWMAERCADLVVSEDVDDHASSFLEKKIRLLAKELDNGDKV